MLSFLKPVVLLLSVTTGLSALPSEDHIHKISVQPSYVGQPGNATYDYVIIGGGTAGLPVAARLAENPKIRVAVIEAGDFYNNSGGNLSAVPGYGYKVSVPGYKTPSAVDWGFQTVPQGALGNRTLLYNRGRTGTTQSFQKWADAVGDTSYTFSNFLTYFRKSVHYTAPNMAIRNKNASVPIPSEESYSAAGGPLQVTHPNWANVESSYAAAAWSELNNTQLRDLTSGVLIGNQYSAAHINPTDQSRSSSETSFLQYAVNSGRNNLVLYTKTMGKQILFDAQRTATGVLAETDGTVYRLSAKKEVVLSAGVFQSPQLLMVSGIGPVATLKSFGIPVIAVRPGVGQNMQDHFFWGHVYQVAVETEVELANQAFNAASIEQYQQNHTGILTNPGSDYFGWEKLPPAIVSGLSSTAQAQLAAFPADWPHYEVVLGDIGVPFAVPSGNYGEAVAMLEAQLSRGTITINSTDTNDLPLVDTQTFANPIDREMAVQAFKRVRSLMTSKSMSRITIGPELYPGLSVSTDEQILQWFVETGAGPGYHAACTCAMGKFSDPNAVVDNQARVFGVNNLRVVDASVFPLLPPGHPVATVYALAEKIADDIKASAAYELNHY